MAGKLIIFVIIIIYFHLSRGWVPILDDANLLFHEAGHPIFGLLSRHLMFYGGTLMQLLIPAICAYEMYKQNKRLGLYFCLIWLAENLLNIARYMADARAQKLPLVGGLDPADAHDWTHILSSWGLLSWDTTLANFVRIVALIVMLGTIWYAIRYPDAENK